MGTSARIDELRKKFDENPRRYFAPLANEYRKAGDLEQAIFICQEYLPQQPGHMSGHIVYGQALYESGRADEAKAVFETALSLDPENLIALRHLGDIARTAGDPAGARGWYQRVLDADPRNEEIIELLTSLDSGEPGVTGAAAPAISSRSTPLRTETIAHDGREDSRVAANAEAPTIEKSEDTLATSFGYGAPAESQTLDDEIELPPLPPSQPAPAAAAPNDDELLDLDDFSLGGIGMESAPPSERVNEPAPVGLDGDVTISGGFTLGTEEADFEADPYAVATPAPEPNVELAADIDLGIADDSTPSAQPDVATAALDGLQTFEAGVIAEAPADVLSLETEAFFDLSPDQTTPTPSILDEPDAPEPIAESPTEPIIRDEVATDAPDALGSAPVDSGHDGDETPASSESVESPAAVEEFESFESFESLESPPVAATTAMETHHEPVPAAPEEAFVTETMAELYIQQGHLDSALDIYRKLVELHPENPDLTDRLRAIEDRMFGVPATAAEPANVRPPMFSGPTIREFLAGLVGRRPANGGSAAPEAPATPVESVDPAERVGSLRRETRMTPGASETITGSIDALFSGAHPSVSDSFAADAFAAAFAGTAPENSPEEPPVLPGTPAHRATDELSLDHVFKANTPPRESGATDGFTFDQFFADETTETSAESSDDAGPGAAEASDDIAQFNAWLNGLKKT
jgi:tetratricopeptide (TPR) repeat protein